MSRAFWVTLAACLAGMTLVPVWAGLTDRVTLGFLLEPSSMGGQAAGPFPGHRVSPSFLLLAVMMLTGPHLAVLATSWSVRRDRRAARVVAGVAVVNLLLTVVALSATGLDRSELSSLLVIFGLPLVQLLVWFAGAVVSGRRGGRPS